MTEHGIHVNENGVMLRPTRSDEIVRRRAAELALPEVKRWQSDLGPDSEVIEDLMRCIGGADGYEIAKDLEDLGWCSNAYLVDILDENFIGYAEDELVKQWVKCLGIKLEIPVGTPVSINFCKKAGVVTNHYPETAKYGVRTPEQSETSCWILLPEEVSTANRAVKVESEVTA